MREHSPFLSFIVIVVLLLIAAFGLMILNEPPIAMVYPDDASPKELLAAREIRRYMYLRSGILPKLASESGFVSPFSDIVYVCQKDRPRAQSLKGGTDFVRRMASLDAENYIITTGQGKRRTVVHIIGGDDSGVLYGAYRYAEHLGVRFYLHGDVVPDERKDAELPFVDDTGKPLFAIRGIQPFHDFPEGPDWWNRDDYKSIVAQLPKLRMNFFGLHTYPEGGPNAEPTVWIGLSGDIGRDGTVGFSYPSSYQNTLRGNWGYAPKRTGEYICGGSLLFDRDDYGNDVMLDMCTEPKNPGDWNEVFGRAGTVLGDVFRFAHSLGVKTCVGTETPLTIPALVKERLASLGKNPADSTVVRELYEGMFRRIAETMPVDYYWFWTPENWTWSGNTDEQVRVTLRDLNVAIEARDTMKAPFELATCGWVLGPRNDRALFHRFLPDSMPMSCINRGVGTVAVDRAFARISGRPTWAIPWLEDDPGLTAVQLWVGRLRSDAVDALRYGCTGLLGIHWRTRVLGPNVSALAHAAWEQEPWIRNVRVPGALEGHVMTPYDGNIWGTEDDILYQTGRSSMNNYRFAVPNGSYSVTLRFCELEFTKRGARMFDVYIQDRKVLDTFDIFARAGNHRALNLTFNDVSVDDYFFEIIFESVVPADAAYGPACISAIEIQGDGVSVKENCGGPVYKDFTADSALINRERVNRDYLTRTSMWEYVPGRYFKSGDFYYDWALNQFGASAAREIARVFERMDGAMPRSADWINGPGGWRPDTVSWQERQRDYDFVGELERLRDRVASPGNLERYDYWLNNFRFMRSSAHLCCAWVDFNTAMEKALKEKDPGARVLSARENGLPRYIEMVTLLEETSRYLLAFVSNYGEMGTVANLEQHILPGLLTVTGKQLADVLGGALPDAALPPKAYTGEPRLIIPTVRTSRIKGETLSLKAILLDNGQPAKAELFWRELGGDEFTAEPLVHVDRGVYTVQFPPSGMKVDDIEYYVRVVTANGKELYFPATAPGMCQTVVMMEGE